MGNVYVFYTTSICIHGRRINTEDLTMKQMFDIPEKLISEQSDEIYGVNATNWEDSSWKHLSLVGGEKSHHSLEQNGLRIFRFCIMSWKNEREPTILLWIGRQIDVVQKFTRIRNLGHN